MRKHKKSYELIEKYRVLECLEDARKVRLEACMFPSERMEVNEEIDRLIKLVVENM